MSTRLKSFLKLLSKPSGYAWRSFRTYWQKNWWHKTVVILFCTLAVMVGGMYGIARWYIATEKGKQELGVSFIPAYAESLGLDPEETLDALINQVGARRFRFVSYWNQLEPEQGRYDFSLLDWQFKKAEAAGAKISLSVGLRQPRWPECHLPDWAKNEDKSVWKPQLLAYVEAVVNRYKNSPALDSYQVENEYFLKGFGECKFDGAMDRDRLVAEYNLVKKLDGKHKVIINRSNNALGWPVGEPQPDEFGISIYKRVWDAQVSHRYLEYPFPAWYYAFVAGWQKIFTGRDKVIHELQAEAWAPNGQTIPEISLEEQNKSFNAERFKARIEFGKGTGMREIYLWGGEYWYYRKVKLHDPTVWNTAINSFN